MFGFACFDFEMKDDYLFCFFILAFITKLYAFLKILREYRGVSN